MQSLELNHLRLHLLKLFCGGCFLSLSLTQLLLNLALGSKYSLLVRLHFGYVLFELPRLELFLFNFSSQGAHFLIRDLNLGCE